jgi:hypothetical protein
VGRGFQHCGSRPFFYDFPKIHHGHSVGQVFHHPEVVRNEYKSKPEIADELGQQIDDLRLYRDI